MSLTIAKKIIITTLSIWLVTSCKQQGGTTVSKDAKTSPSVSLQMFNSGQIKVNRLEAFSDSLHLYKGQSKAFVDPTYIITHHPTGKRLIWDTGLPEAIGKTPITPGDGTFTLSRQDSLVNQLKTLQLSYDDFDYIALSHSHFDHTGTANYFKNATWLVQANEYEFITNKDNAALGLAVSELTKVEKLKGDYDVFGDGSVVIKYTPGHTIGHQSLYIDLGLKRPILLTGDLYHFQENRQNKISPSFNYNFEQTRASMEAFETFAKQKNAIVIIQHSPKDYKKLQELLKNKTIH